MSTELVERKSSQVQIGSHGIIPTDINTVKAFAVHVARAPSFKRFNDESDALVAIVWGLEHGMSMAQSVQSLYTINGKVTPETEALKAIVIASGKASVIEGDFMRDDKGQVYGYRSHCKRKDGLIEQTYEFTVDDAKRAGLWEKAGPWKAYPKRMLMWRATAFNLRDVFPDVCQGVMSAEEATDTWGEVRETVATDINEPAASKIDDPLLGFDGAGETLDATVESETPEPVASSGPIPMTEAEIAHARLQEYRDAGEDPPADLLSSAGK